MHKYEAVKSDKPLKAHVNVFAYPKCKRGFGDGAGSVLPGLSLRRRPPVQRVAWCNYDIAQQNPSLGSGRKRKTETQRDPVQDHMATWSFEHGADMTSGSL